VEDDADVAFLVARQLQKAGYRVRIAPGAEDALAGLADDLPDLITVDIELPDMQGDELVKRLQADLSRMTFRSGSFRCSRTEPARSSAHMPVQAH